MEQSFGRATALSADRKAFKVGAKILSTVKVAE